MKAEEIRKLQLEELKMLKVVSEICERHNLTYYVMGGTLLGAVRNHGFIPWDDDLDIGFKREEYDLFLKYAAEELEPPYSVLTIGNDKNYIHLFSRIVNNNIKLCRENTKAKMIQKLWVDIFPLDGAPKEKTIRRILWEKKIYVMRGLRNLSCFSDMVDISKEYHGIKKAIVYIGLHTGIEKMLPTHKILVILDRYLRRFKLSDNPCIGNPMGGSWFKEVYPKEYYEDVVLLPFEDVEVNCPHRYEAILEQMYGDYMTPPPKEERNKHGTSLVSWEK